LDWCIFYGVVFFSWSGKGGFIVYFSMAVLFGVLGKIYLAMFVLLSSQIPKSISNVFSNLSSCIVHASDTSTLFTLGGHTPRNNSFTAMRWGVVGGKREECENKGKGQGHS
jgi:hypothetical protein